MEETILLLVFRITVFLSMTDIQNAQLQTLPNPCPYSTPSITIADMCTTDYATEVDTNGGTTVDSVALRVMTQQDGCECEVTLQNQKTTHTIYMRKYDLNTNASPEKAACGLSIDIDYNIPNNLPENKNPVECIEGTQPRSISLTTNGILHLRSRVINGTFTRGYCMQIFRTNSIGNTETLQLHCSQYFTTTPGKHITKYNEFVTDVENGNEKIPVIIAAVIGWCLTALFAITTVCLYRRMKMQRPNNSGEQDVNRQYQDLHVTRLSSCYSSLNASAVNSDQHEHI